MKGKVSKTNILLAVFTLTLALSVYETIMLPSVYLPSYAIIATKIDYKPSNYFVLNNPDKYVLEAISNQQSSVFRSLDETQIDELTGNYLTNKVEYKGTYYEISIIFGDNFLPFMLPQILLAGIAISATGITVISFYKIAKYIKKQK